MNRRAFLAASLVAAAAPARALGAPAGGGFVALVTADLESHIVAVDVVSGRIVKRIPTAEGPRSIETSRFGHVVVAHTGAGVVTLLDASTLSVRSVLRDFVEPRYTATHRSRELAYVTDSGRRDVTTLALAGGRVVHRTPVPGPARHVTLDWDGRSLWVALGTKAERIAVLDLIDPRRPRLRRVFAPPFPAHDVVGAPDGRHVWVTSGTHDAIAIYPLAGGRPRLLAADAPPQHVGFSDRRAFVSSGADGTVRLQRLDGNRVRSIGVPRRLVQRELRVARRAAGTAGGGDPLAGRGNPVRAHRGM